MAAAMKGLLILLLLAVMCLASFPDTKSPNNEGQCTAPPKEGGDGKGDAGGTCSAGGAKADEKKKAGPKTWPWWQKYFDREAREQISDDHKELAPYLIQEGMYEGRVEKEIIKRLNATRRVIDERCSSLTGRCFQVIDHVYNDVQGIHYNPWEVIRSTVLKSNPIQHFGRGTLIRPEKLTWKNFDSKQWKMNPHAVIDKELQSVIGAPFGVKAVPRDEEELENNSTSYNVLVLGLGSGVVPNFLRSRYWINLTVVEEEPVLIRFARKWFGFYLSPNVHLVKDDGIRYLMRAAREGRKFDFIIVTRCDETASEGRLCPDPRYLERSTAEVIKKILPELGGLAVNSRSTEDKIMRDTMNALGGSFPQCIDYPATDPDPQLWVDRYSSTICYNREHNQIWKDPRARSDFIRLHTQSWFYQI